MVLVEHRCNFFSIETNGQECFLVVVSGDVEDKHISSSKRACEDAGFVIHTTTIVGRATLKNNKNQYHVFISKIQTFEYSLGMF